MGRKVGRIIDSVSSGESICRCGTPMIPVRLICGGKGRMVWRHKESYSPSEKECLLAGQRLFESLVAASEAADVGKIESAITALKAEVGALEKSLAEKIFGDSLTAGVYIQKFRIGLAEAHNRMVFLRVAQTTETS